MASTEGGFAAPGGEIGNPQARRFSKRLRGEGVSTSSKAEPASPQKKVCAKDMQHGVGPSSSTTESAEVVQSKKGEREIVIKREYFPAQPPDRARFRSMPSYEKFIRPYLDKTITINDEWEVGAKAAGYEDYVHAWCNMIVD